jgi:hypothetical protein
MFISQKIKDEYNEEKGNHYVATKSIQSGENLMVIPFQKCIVADKLTSGLSSWNLVEKVAENVSEYPTMETYRASAPIYMKVCDLLNLCKNHGISDHYIFYNLLVKLRIVSVMVFESESKKTPAEEVGSTSGVGGEQFKLYKFSRETFYNSSYLHAYHIVNTRCWGHKQKYYMVPFVDVLNNTSETKANCIVLFKNKTVRLKALFPIKKGEELKWCYSPTSFREKILLNYHYIDMDFEPMKYFEFKEFFDNNKSEPCRAVIKYINDKMIPSALANDQSTFDYFCEHVMLDPSLNILLDLCLQ